jgi:AhpC/TSA antioxidant enzyme
VRSRLDEFGDAEVVVVCFSAPGYVAAYQRGRLQPMTVLVDDARASYRAYGFGRGSVRKVWGLRTWRAYARLLRAGRRLRRPTEDTLQLGGDVVVDREGTISYLFRSADPDDRPSVDDLLGAVRRS